MIDDRAVEAAIAKFAEYGIEFASPRDGGLDDLELERYNALSDALTAAAPFLTPQIPDGWKLVPVEATKEMMAAFDGMPSWTEPGEEAREVWRAMLSATPPPPQERTDG